MGEHHWWSNVYNDNWWDGPNGVAYVLDKSHPTREAADLYQTAGRIGCVHIRLKPEGAPKRYASEAERERWEHFSGMEWTPEQIARLTELAEPFARTPKIEART